MGIVVNALSQALVFMGIKAGPFGLAHFDENWTSDQENHNKDAMFSRQNFTRENQRQNDSKRTDGKLLLLEISKTS